MVGDILNYIATESGFTYRLHAIPKPVCMGYSGWERWTIDQASRADLLAQWTTDSWGRQRLGVSWPFHQYAARKPNLRCALLRTFDV